MYYYAISDGSYSDYEVLGFYSSDKEISEEKFKEYWQEAIKRKSAHYDKALKALSKYLKIPKMSDVYDYQSTVGFEKYKEALIATGYKYKYEADFFKEVLTENGLIEIPYQEYNIEDL